MEPEKKPSLNFAAFKDWAFLGILGFLTTMLVDSIRDLNTNVKALTVQMAERALENSSMLETQKDHESRIRLLEQSRALHR